MLERWKQERKIRRVLKRIARQYVSNVAKTGWWNDARFERPVPQEPVLTVRHAFLAEGDDIAAVETCLMRGWVEVLYDKKPSQLIPDDGRPVMGPTWPTDETHYRVTGSGWAALNRAHAWSVARVLIGLLVALLTFAAKVLLGI